MAKEEHVICPECQAVNRVAGERLRENPTCGKCGESILEAKPLDLDELGLERQKNKSSLPLVVDFFAPWCGHCRQMSPFFDQAADSLFPKVRFAKVNTEKEQALAGRLGIKSIPTLILYKDGEELARSSGVLQPDAIVDWISGQL